jgi:hypothetical protein
VSLISSLFGDRDKAISELKVRLVSIRANQTLMAKRLSYLERHRPEIHEHLTKRTNPVARLSSEEKQKIADDVDSWLEPLK